MLRERPLREVLDGRWEIGDGRWGVHEPDSDVNQARRGEDDTGEGCNDVYMGYGSMYCMFSLFMEVWLCSSTTKARICFRL